MATNDIELARQEGTEFRSVRLSVGDDGVVTLIGQDMGPRVEAIWGDSEYEFWLRIEQAAVPKLVFELLNEKLAGRLDAIDAFRNWCKAHGIAHEFGSWA